MEERRKPLNRVVSRIYPFLEDLAGMARGAGKALNRGGDLAAGRALKALQRGLTGDRSLVGRDYFADKDHLAAYLLYYWPVSFAQTWLCLEEMEARGIPAAAPRVLDIGAGPGPASFAAVLRGGGGSSVLVDANARALEAACRLAARLDLPMEAFRADAEAFPSLPEGPFDLVLACHSVNELWKGQAGATEKRAHFLAQAAARLAPGGILLVIEPSALVTSRPALELRNLLLSESYSGSFDCAAPCPSSDPCPAISAGEGRSCHSTWAWNPLPQVATLAAAAGLDRDSVKATWFALRKKVASRPVVRSGSGIAAVGTHAKTQASSGAQSTEFGVSGRIVSEGLLNKADRLRFLVCEGQGLCTISAPARAPWALQAGFDRLGRGDLIEASGLEPRPGERSFGFGPESRLATRFKAPEAGS